MLCERCKIREATIKYTEIINGVKTEHNLCSHCDEGDGFGQYSALLGWDVPLGKLLSGLLGLEDDEEETDVRGNVVSPHLRHQLRGFCGRTAGSDALTVMAYLICLSKIR